MPCPPFFPKEVKGLGTCGCLRYVSALILLKNNRATHLARPSLPKLLDIKQSHLLSFSVAHRTTTASIFVHDLTTPLLKLSSPVKGSFLKIRYKRTA